MIFGDMPLAGAEGAILAHAVRHREGTFRKGRVLSTTDIALLEASGISHIFAARLERGDVPEDAAAGQVAELVTGAFALAQEPFTGRANIHAAQHGVAIVDAARVRALNRVHESITLATVVPFARVAPRQLVGTVKIIPFAVSESVLAEARAVLADGPVLSVAPFKPHGAGLVITELPGGKESLVAKGRSAIAARLEALGSRLGDCITCSHEPEAVTAAIKRLQEGGHDPILVMGASAIVDRGDVVPAALTAAGGRIVHLGMPVDPGNLLMLGALGQVPVIGVPSCARSPKVNGFDWVMERVLAGITVTPEDMMDMGPGGLLMEIASRPAPREAAAPGNAPRAPEIAAVVLAAGRSTRMGRNKLLELVHGEPMIRSTVTALIASQAKPVVVVTGHEAEKVTEALRGLDVNFVHNPDYGHGLASSLVTGVRVVPASADGAIIALGDMPLVTSRQVDKLIAAFNPVEGRGICVPVHDGKRGNPVLWGRAHFGELATLTGDQGAKHLLEVHAEDLAEVGMESDAIHRDFDTPDTLAAVSKPLT